MRGPMCSFGTNVVGQSASLQRFSTVLKPEARSSG
jgi:hypothetical protein